MKNLLLTCSGIMILFFSTSFAIGHKLEYVLTYQDENCTVYISTSITFFQMDSVERIFNKDTVYQEYIRKSIAYQKYTNWEPYMKCDTIISQEKMFTDSIKLRIIEDNIYHKFIKESIAFSEYFNKEVYIKQKR